MPVSLPREDLQGSEPLRATLFFATCDGSLCHRRISDAKSSAFIGRLHRRSARRPNHLRCAHAIPANADPTRIRSRWNDAKRNGAGSNTAGHPDIQPIHQLPTSPCIGCLSTSSYSKAIAGGASIALVEKYGPLLAHQLTVDSNRSGHHCGAITKTAPLTEQLMACCLPLASQPEQIQTVPGQELIVA